MLLRQEACDVFVAVNVGEHELRDKADRFGNRGGNTPIGVRFGERVSV